MTLRQSQQSCIYIFIALWAYLHCSKHCNVIIIITTINNYLTFLCLGLRGPWSLQAAQYWSLVPSWRCQTGRSASSQRASGGWPSGASAGTTTQCKQDVMDYWIILIYFTWPLRKQTAYKQAITGLTALESPLRWTRQWGNSALPEGTTATASGLEPRTQGWESVASPLYFFHSTNLTRQYHS